MEKNNEKTRQLARGNTRFRRKDAAILRQRRHDQRKGPRPKKEKGRQWWYSSLGNGGRIRQCGINGRRLVLDYEVAKQRRIGGRNNEFGPKKRDKLKKGVAGLSRARLSRKVDSVKENKADSKEFPQKKRKGKIAKNVERGTSGTSQRVSSGEREAGSTIEPRNRFTLGGMLR